MTNQYETLTHCLLFILQPIYLYNLSPHRSPQPIGSVFWSWVVDRGFQVVGRGSQVVGRIHDSRPSDTPQPITSRVYQRLLYLLTNQIEFLKFEFLNFQLTVVT